MAVTLKSIGSSKLVLLAIIAVFFTVFFIPTNAKATEDDESSAQILGTVNLPRSAIAKGIRVVVDGGAKEALVHSDGTFVIHDVSAGSHSVDVYGIDYVFPSYRVDVNAKKGVRTIAYLPTGATSSNYPLVIDPLGPASYFEVRPPFDFMALLKNPMVLMMVVPLGMMFLMSKMDMDSINQQMQEAQAELQNVNNAGASSSSTKAVKKD